MKKFLGIGFVFSAIDKGLNKFFDKANNNVEEFNDKLEDTGQVKSKKGSILNAIGEIAKLGLLKSMNDGISDLGSKLENAQKGIVGGGLSEEFKTVEGLTKRLTLRLGDSAKAAKLVDQSISGIVRGAKVTTETATEITGAFVKNNLEIDKFKKSLLLSAKFSKAFDLSAQEVSGSFALGLKTMGFTEKSLSDITSQVTLLETKTGLSGIAGNLPNVLALVKEQMDEGLITKGQAKAQTQRINNLITKFRNTGIEIGDAQAHVTSLSGGISKVAGAFADIGAGKDAGALGDLANSFGKLGLNVGSVKKAFASGNINASLDIIRKASAKAQGLGKEQRQAFNVLLKDAFGDDVLKIITATQTKAFNSVNGAIKSTNKALRDGSAAKQAQKAFSVLTDTVEDQETQLKGLNQEFERGVSNSIAGSIKEYNKFKIKSLESLSDATKGTDSFFLKGVVALKKFQQGGLLPFADSLSKLPGITKEGIFKVNSAIDTIGPVLKEGADEAFFFTGALANIAKVAPSPIGFLKKMGGGLTGTAGKLLGFGKAAEGVKGGLFGLTKTGGGLTGAIGKMGGMFSKVGGLGGMFSGVMKGVGVAVRFATGPVGLIIAGLTALGAGLIYAYKNSETFRGIVDDTWESLKVFGEGIWNFATAIIPPTIDGIKEMASVVWDFGGKILPKVWTYVKKGTNFFMEWLNPFGLITKAINGLGKLFPNVFGGFADMLKPITEVFTNFSGVVGKTFDKVTSFVKDSTVGKIFGEMFGDKKKEKTSIAQKEKKKSGGFFSSLNPFSSDDEKPEVQKIVKAKTTTEQAANINQPKVVTNPTVMADNVVSINRGKPQPIAMNGPQAEQVLGATRGNQAFTATPTQNVKQRQEAQGNIEDPNIKNLAIIFSSIGTEIVQAIKEGQSSVNIQLKGDAKKLFSASQSGQNNRMVTRGLAG